MYILNIPNVLIVPVNINDFFHEFNIQLVNVLGLHFQSL